MRQIPMPLWDTLRNCMRCLLRCVFASGYLSSKEGGIGIHCKIPGVEHKFGVGRRDWMDGTMSGGKSCQPKPQVVELETNSEGIKDGSVAFEDSKRIHAQVHSGRYELALKSVSEEFIKGAALYHIS